MAVNPELASRIQIIQGDITTCDVDAIVNAANSTLLGGGGVDGAIHRAAGPKLLEECRTLGGCPVGEARITKGYRLPARHVIHTVGPVYDSDRYDAATMLQSCYASCFQLAREYDLRSLAFPAISCGAYGYPMIEAAPIALDETVRQIEQNPQIEKVFFVLFDQAGEYVYRTAWAKMGDD